jgi:hypothetical protein
MEAVRSFSDICVRELFHDHTHDKLPISAVRTDVVNIALIRLLMEKF